MEKRQNEEENEEWEGRNSGGKKTWKIGEEVNKRRGNRRLEKGSTGGEKLRETDKGGERRGTNDGEINDRWDERGV